MTICCRKLYVCLRQIFSNSTIVYSSKHRRHFTSLGQNAKSFYPIRNFCLAYVINLDWFSIIINIVNLGDQDKLQPTNIESTKYINIPSRYRGKESSYEGFSTFRLHSTSFVCTSKENVSTRTYWKSFQHCLRFHS